MLWLTYHNRFRNRLLLLRHVDQKNHLGPLCNDWAPIKVYSTTSLAMFWWSGQQGQASAIWGWLEWWLYRSLQTTRWPCLHECIHSSFTDGWQGGHASWPSSGHLGMTSAGQAGHCNAAPSKVNLTSLKERLFNTGEGQGFVKMLSAARTKITTSAFTCMKKSNPPLERMKNVNYLRAHILYIPKFNYFSWNQTFFITFIKYVCQWSMNKNSTSPL